MLLADILFLTIVVYLAYRFIFNFLLPIVRATHQVRQQFRNMRGSGGSGGSPRGSSDAAASGAASASRPGSGGGGSRTAGNGSGKGTYKPPAEDYIDFEEVK